VGIIARITYFSKSKITWKAENPKFLPVQASRTFTEEYAHLTSGFPPAKVIPGVPVECGSSIIKNASSHMRLPQ
jgi:hypothetical protein